jgi:hypothetical protein
MRLKFAVKTTNKNSDRVSCCLDNWLFDLDYVCITDKKTGIFQEISCGEGENYESAEEKVCNFFGMIREGLFSDYDWVMLIDDDAILDSKRLFSIIPSLNPRMIHGYDMKRAWVDDLSLSFPSGGGGYLVSPSLVRSSTPMPKIGIGVEDVRVGMWMRENGLEIGSLPVGPWFPLGVKYWEFQRIEQESPELIEDMVKNLPDSDKSFIRSKITHHYIRGANTMRYLYRLMIS